MKKADESNAREERLNMARMLENVQTWLLNTLVEAPDTIQVDKDGTVKINYFTEDGPKIRSIIEGVGTPQRWEINRHGMFLHQGQISIMIYSDNRSFWLDAPALLKAFFQD